MVDGQWSMVNGRWSMVDGRWGQNHWLYSLETDRTTIDHRPLTIA
jgi:hypothetical protein